MKFKSVVLLAVAVGCGLVAMLGVQQVLSDNSAEDEKQVAMVLVAIADISPGTPLDETNTLLKESPAEAVPEGAVTSREEVQEQTLKTSAVPNEIIMLAKLQDFKGASAEIPSGMRVVTTSVNLTKTHSGLIRPGDRVDILLSFKVKHPEWGQIKKTKTVLEYIEIFATDSFRRSGDPADVGDINAKNLSFLVTPAQANLLMLAENHGNLTLALRHKGDNEQVHTPDIDESLFNDFMTGFGKEEEDQDNEPVLVADAGPTDIRTAIADELSGSETTPPTDDAQVPEDLEPEIPTWQILIYSGDKVITQEVPLEVDENGLTEEEAAFAEREAKLYQWEAMLEAREQALNGTQQEGGTDDNPTEAVGEQPLPDDSEKPGPQRPEDKANSTDPKTAKDAKPFTNGKQQFQKFLKQFLSGA